MAITVVPTGARNTHHLKLSKSGTSIGLILARPDGSADEAAIQRAAYPRSAIHFYQGDKEFSDLEPPYRNVAQKNWTGGRGSIDFDEDANRFFDSLRANTLHKGKILLGGLESYATGYRSLDQAMPGSVTFVALTGASRYLAREFNASASYNADKVRFLIKKVGSPIADLGIRLWDDLAGNPNAVLKSVNLSAASVTDTLSLWVEFNWSGTQALVSGTAYHIGLLGGASDDASNHWEVAIDTAITGEKSSDGSTWSSATGAPYFRIADTNIEQYFLFFEYKRAIYAVTRPDDGANSSLYMNGDRGAADSNAGQLTKLIDATKTWVTNQWAGGIALVIRGPGSEESQPWRNIDSNTATQLTVDNAWLVAHTTSTEYVIIETDVWQALSGVSLGGHVTDVAVSGEYVYFARGDRSSDPNILRYQEYNNAGTWTRRNDTDIVPASKLLVILDPNEGPVLWGARNRSGLYDISVWKGLVPQEWDDLYQDQGVVLPTKKPWDAWQVANVTQKAENGATVIDVAAGFTTGVAAVENLEEPVDITQGNDLQLLVYSTVATNSGDLQLIYDDQPNLGQQYQPTGAKHVEVAAGAPTYVSLTKAIDELDETYQAVSLTNNGFLLIFSSVKFNKIHVNMGSVVNAVAATLSGEYSSGDGFTALTITDGTASGGATLAQDGDITFTPPQDWESATVDGVTGYALLLKPSATLTASIEIIEIYVERKNNVTLNIPALTANTWAWVRLAITPTEYPDPDETVVQSFALKVAVDNGAQVVYIRDAIKLISDEVTYTPLPAFSRITNLQAYAGSADAPRTNPWVFTENNVYEIQTQNQDKLVPLPLQELGEIRSETNGRAATTNGVYLWFNLGQKVERYYNRQLEDVGPDLGEGLPSGRAGVPSRMLSFPGLVIVAVDADTNTSSVLSYENAGWHELYRAPFGDERIRDLIIQDIPGFNKRARLWISEGPDLLWIPLSVNPQSDTSYRYVHEAALESARFYVGMQDIDKFFKAVKLASENLTSVAPKVQVRMDYKLASSTTWTEFASIFDVSPFEEINLSAAYDKADRWLQLRLRLQTEDATKTPEVIAHVLECIERVPIKRTFTLNIRLADDDVNLLGERDETDGSTKLTQLDTWETEATPLLMNGFASIYDNKYVVPEPNSLKITKKYYDERGKEFRIAQFVLLEI